MTTDHDPGPEGHERPYRPDADPQGAGWVSWQPNPSYFNSVFGTLRSLRDGDRAIVRMQPHAGLGNMLSAVHGGAVMAYVDVAMFIGARILGSQSALLGVTVDCSVQFAGRSDLVRPLDAIVQLTRETGRLLFMRGTVEQDGDMVASFIGVLRKAR